MFSSKGIKLHSYIVIQLYSYIGRDIDGSKTHSQRDFVSERMDVRGLGLRSKDLGSSFLGAKAVDPVVIPCRL